MSIVFCISCDDHIIFTIGLNMLYLLCILGISKSWSWYRMISTWCWNQFATLLRIFASILVKDVDLYFSYHDNLLIFLWGFPCIRSVSFLLLLCNFSVFDFWQFYYNVFWQSSLWAKIWAFSYKKLTNPQINSAQRELCQNTL